MNTSSRAPECSGSNMLTVFGTRETSLLLCQVYSSKLSFVSVNDVDNSLGLRKEPNLSCLSRVNN